MGRLRQTASFATALYQERAALAARAYIGRDEISRLALRPGRDNPYVIYERLRARGTITATPLGNWASTDHGVCSRVLRDRRFGVRPAGTEPVEDEFDLSFLALNPPDHTRLRRLVAPAFSPKQMAAWQPRIDKTVHGLLDRAGRTFDLVPALASPLPIAVISELLGVPYERADDFVRYGRTIGSALGGIRSLRHAADLVRAQRELEQLFVDLFALRRRQPADDVITTIVRAEGETVRPREMVPLCTLLLIAGFETTVNLISNAVLALLDHRDQWAALCADPSRAGAAVEETLRYDPPVQRTSRVALEDLELDGRPVAKDQLVLTLIGGANRDPQIYTEPARFDITRSHTVDNLAFSSGIHYCLGQPLARLEATIAVRALADRLPGLHRAGRVVRRNATVVRGPLRLPVRAG